MLENQADLETVQRQSGLDKLGRLTAGFIDEEWLELDAHLKLIAAAIAACCRKDSDDGNSGDYSAEELAAVEQHVRKVLELSG